MKEQTNKNFLKEAGFEFKEIPSLFGGLSRWDIVEGHYAYYSDYHSGQNSLAYEKICRMQKYFQPSWSWSSDTLSEGAQVVYDNLVAQNS